MLKLIIDKKEVVHPFCTKTIISNEICILLDKILGQHDNVLLAGDLNIDELKTGSGLSNHLSDAKEILTTLAKKRTCFKSQDETLIDLMLANRQRTFFKTQNFEIGLIDCHKLVVSILRASIKKPPRKL